MEGNWVVREERVGWVRYFTCKISVAEDLLWSGLLVSS